MRGLPIGYSKWWERLRYETRKGFTKKPGESSMMLIAPARSGKFTDILAPMLFDWEGSCIVLDPKGQLASVTAYHRQKRLRQNVIILNPFNEWPEFIGDIPHSGFNPLISTRSQKISARTAIRWRKESSSKKRVIATATGRKARNRCFRG